LETGRLLSDDLTPLDDVDDEAKFAAKGLEFF
jgi:hypothetical protein